MNPAKGGRRQTKRVTSHLNSGDDWEQEHWAVLSAHESSVVHL